MRLDGLQLGNLILPWPLLVLVLGLLTVLCVGYFFNKRQHWEAKVWHSFKESLWSAVWVGLLSARMVFVLIHADLYFSNPIDIIKIQDKGFHLYGGLFIGILWFLWKNKSLRLTVLASCLFIFISVYAGGSAWLKQRAVYQSYPELIFNDLNQQPQLLTSLVGKKTVINLWASWCPWCHKEMPVLQQAEQDYPEVQFVMLNQGESLDEVSAYLQRYDLVFKHVLLDPQTDMAQQLNLFGLPTTLFFNEDGELVDVHNGELSKAKLRQYLKKMTI